MKLLTHTARVVAGLIFAFSGFVKGIDPMGTAFKLGDYFSAFRLGFLDDLALPLAVLLIVIEFVTGMMLLSGALVKPASWMAAIFMAIFLPLTLVLAIWEPVSDCGCFGDAVILTNWQTFFKNILIAVPVVWLFLRRDEEEGTMSLKTGLNFTVIFIFLFLIFIRINLTCLPMIDFRPYRVGTDLAAAMTVPDDAEPDRYDIRFIYEKEGVQKEFTLENYPADDTTWTFVDQKSVLISKGYLPELHDFTLTTEYGIDMTEQITRHQGDMLLMVARRLEQSNRDGLMKGYRLGMELQQRGVAFHIVTATPPMEAEPLTTGFSALFADEITLKTVIRSDPGFVLLHNGIVAAKWSYRNLPENELFAGDLTALALTEQVKRGKREFTLLSLLAIVAAVAVTIPFRTVRARERGRRSIIPEWKR